MLRSSSTSGQWTPNPPPATRQFRPLLRRRYKETRVPCEGHGDRAAGDQIHDQQILREADVLDALARPTFGSTHSNQPLPFLTGP